MDLIPLIIGAFLWFTFGYVWDYPFRKVRKLKLEIIHFSFIVTLALLFMYVFFPSAMLIHIHWKKIIDIQINRTEVRIAAVTALIVGSIMHYYVGTTHSEREKTRYHRHAWSQTVSRLVLMTLVIFSIAILFLFFRNILHCSTILAMVLGIWLGPCLQFILKIETEIFSDQTQHKWQQ